MSDNCFDEVQTTINVKEIKDIILTNSVNSAICYILFISDLQLSNTTELSILFYRLTTQQTQTMRQRHYLCYINKGSKYLLSNILTDVIVPF